MGRIKTAYNTGFASGGLTCKLGVLCFYSGSVLVDSFVLRNPPERKARKRYVQCDSNLMILYKRNIDKRLLSVRLTFFILGTICFFAFKSHYDNLGYFIAVALISLSLIVINDFTVSNDSFLISKYYFFGLIKRAWQFNKGDNIKLSSFGSDFGQEGEIPDYDSTASGVGCIFSIFAIFLPPKITMKEFKVEKFDEFNKRSRSVYILLDRPEFNYLQTFTYQPQST